MTFPLSHREPADFAGVAVSFPPVTARRCFFIAVAVSFPFSHCEAADFAGMAVSFPLQSLRGSVMPKQSHSVSVTARRCFFIAVAVSASKTEIATLLTVARKDEERHGSLLPSSVTARLLILQA